MANQWGQFKESTDGEWHIVYLNIETNMSFTAIISMFYRSHLFAIEPRSRTTSFQISVKPASEPYTVATKEGGYIHVGA